MIEAHPWVGVGPEQVGRQFLAYVPPDAGPPLPEGWYGHLHNVYLQYAAERGIPVLLIFLALVGVVLWRGIRTAAHAPLVHGVVAALIALMVGGIFEFNLGDSEVLTLFLALLACVYVPQPERA
jgi:O-antigen ligase